MKIKYHNVGSIRDAEVEYKPGQLVAIVGETNQGKSLQFYSLLAGFTNTPDFKRFLNNKALKEDKNAYESIELTDDTGKTWIVRADKSSMTYQVGDMKYTKVGKKSIFEIANAQIPGLLYDPDNCTPIMNIVDEDTGMFPIDRSDSQIFKTYERLLSLSSTEDILRSIKLDLEDIDYNITDRLKSVESNNKTLELISKCLDTINEDALDTILNQVSNSISVYSNLKSIYDKTKDTADYIDVISKASFDRAIDFDLEDFKKKLELLVFSNKILSYCNSSDIDYSALTDFDSSKLLFYQQSLAKAEELSKELDDLSNNIETDKSDLEGINNILKQIKVCPLCGKPME